MELMTSFQKKKKKEKSMKEWRTIISSSLELRRNETQPCPLLSYDLLCSDRAVSLPSAGCELVLPHPSAVITYY